MAFHKIDNLADIEYLSLTKTLRDLNEQRKSILESNAQKQKNTYVEQTMPEAIKLANLQAAMSQKVLPSKADLEVAQAMSAQKVLPSSTQSQIAQNLAAISKSGLEEKYPLFSIQGATPYAVFDYFNNRGKPEFQQSSTASQPSSSSQPNATTQNTGNAAQMPLTPENFYGIKPETPEAAFALNNLILPQVKDKAIAEWEFARTSNLPYNQMTPDAKAKEEGIAQANNVDVGTFVKLRSSGQTLPQALEILGVPSDRQTLSPDYLPSGSARTAITKAEGAASEYSFLMNQISPVLAKYATKIKGTSPKLVWEGLSGIDEKDQAQYIGARGLATEAAALSNMMTGIASGHGTIEEMKNALFGKMNDQYPWLKNTQVMQDAFNYQSKMLDEAVKVRIESMKEGKIIDSQTPNKSEYSSNGNVTVMSPDGKYYSMPIADAQMAISQVKGAKIVG